MTPYDHTGAPVHAEDVLDRQELGAYYDRHGIEWRRPGDDEDETNQENEDDGGVA